MTAACLICGAPCATDRCAEHRGVELDDSPPTASERALLARLAPRYAPRSAAIRLAYELQAALGGRIEDHVSTARAALEERCS